MINYDTFINLNKKIAVILCLILITRQLTINSLGIAINPVSKSATETKMMKYEIRVFNLPCHKIMEITKTLSIIAKMPIIISIIT